MDIRFHIRLCSEETVDGLFEVVFESRGDTSTGFQEEKKHIERVEKTGVYVDGGSYTRLLQVFDIGQRLRVKRLRRAYEGIRRGKTSIVCVPGGRGIGGNWFFADAAEIARPAIVIAAGVLYRRVVIPGGFGILVVQHGVEGHLKGDMHAANVLFIHAQRCGQSAVGAFIAHHDLITAHTQLRRMRFQIGERVVAVQQSRRVGSYSGQTIIRTNDNRTIFFTRFFARDIYTISGMPVM